MNTFTGENLQELIKHDADWAVSIFMSTHRSGPDTRQDPIRFKNLLRMAEHAMHNRGLDNGQMEALEPATQLVSDNSFWQHQSDGLAMFVGPDYFKYFVLPFHFPENVLVDRRFHIRPLLPVYHGNGRFYLLTLSQKRVRVFQCTRDHFEEIQVVGVPTTIEEYMQFVDETSARDWRPPMPHGGRGVASYNRHGTGVERGKQRIKEFFQQVNNGLHDLLHEENAPLIVASVDYLYPIYKEANTYGHLVESHLTGNPEASTGQELHRDAWNLLVPRFRVRQDAAVEQYLQLDGSPRASRKLKEIVPGAHSSRIETLLVASDHESWGIYDQESGDVRETKSAPPEAQELINYSSVLTLQNGGNVYVLSNEEMPHGAPMAAIFRY